MKSWLNGKFPHQAQRARDQGFSLVELLIVTAIGMVLLAFTVPVLQNAMRNYNLNAAASNVARISQLARYTAIRQGANACTVLNGRIFGIDANCDGTVDANLSAYALPSSITLEDTGPATTGMDFSTAPTAVVSPYTITFTSRGSTTVAPTANLIYVAGWGNSAAVTVSGAGRARSWRYNGSAWY